MMETNLCPSGLTAGAAGSFQDWTPRDASVSTSRGSHTDLAPPAGRDVRTPTAEVIHRYSDVV